MSQKNEVKPRHCHVCNEKFDMTAKQIKAHAEDCRTAEVGVTAGLTNILQRVDQSVRSPERGAE